MPKRALAEKRPWLLASLAAAIGFYVYRNGIVSDVYLSAWKGLAIGLLAVYALLRHPSRHAWMLAGVMGLLLLYGLFVQRGLRTAMLVKDEYSKLLASGLSFMFALQVFVIVGGVTGLIPLTGITTPFLSQGGSSLVASWLLVAVLARLSDGARRPAPKPIQDEGMTQVVSLR